MFALAAAATLAFTSPLHAAQSAQKGPYVTALSDRDATVRFELQTAAPATIEVTAQASADASTIGPSRYESREVSAFHRVLVTGLEPATPYSLVGSAAKAASSPPRDRSRTRRSRSSSMATIDPTTLRTPASLTP
jgi:hypothetical protein